MGIDNDNTVMHPDKITPENTRINDELICETVRDLPSDNSETGQNVTEETGSASAELDNREAHDEEQPEADTEDKEPLAENSGVVEIPIAAGCLEQQEQTKEIIPPSQTDPATSEDNRRTVDYYVGLIESNIKAEKHVLYTQCLVSDNKGRYLLRKYKDAAMLDWMKSLYNNAEDAELLKDMVAWPIAISEKPNDKGEFLCVLPAPSESNVRLSDLIEITRTKNVQLKLKPGPDLCIAYAKLLFTLVYLCNGKYLSFFDPSEIYMNPDDGSIVFTGFEQITDDDSKEKILHSKKNEKSGVSFIPMRFMPPAWLQNGIDPTADDLSFYLALFCCLVLLRSHPYEGKRWAEYGFIGRKEGERLYGSGRTFIFDNEDDSNRPVTMVHGALPQAFWNKQPQRLKTAFSDFFNGKLTNDEKPNLKEWVSILIDYKSSLCYCQCGNPIFAEPGADAVCCEYCKRKITLPYKIVINEEKVFPLEKDKIFWGSQFELNCHNSMFLEPMLQIVGNKSNDNLGIKVLSDELCDVYLNDENTDAKTKIQTSDKPILVRQGRKLTVGASKVTIQ